MTVWDELYRYHPLARLKVPILVHPKEVSNKVPTEAEVDMALQGMRTGREGGPSVMRAE